MSANPEQQIERKLRQFYAIHEAAHAVAFMVTGQHPREPKAYIRISENGGVAQGFDAVGLARHEALLPHLQPGIRKILRRQFYDAVSRAVVGLLAGFVAETIAGGVGIAESEFVEDSVAMILDHGPTEFYENYDLTHPEGETGQDMVRAIELLIERRQTFGPRRCRAVLISQIVDEFLELEARAFALLREPWAWLAVRRIANRLQKTGCLPFDEVARIADRAVKGNARSFSRALDIGHHWP